MTPSIRVIIVNYNAGATITRVIRSVLDSGESTAVTVYDNASSDGSLESVKRVFIQADNVEVIAGPENIGFAAAVNLVAGSASEPYLLVLNPDCELFPGALGHLTHALDENPDAALAGPLVVNRQGAVQRGTLRRFPDPWSALATFSGAWRLGKWIPALNGVERAPLEVPGNVVEAEAVTGACMFIRREMYEQSGGLDEEYGLHCEDLDLMYRFSQLGFKSLLVPAARVFHQQGVSSSSRPVWVHWHKHLGMQRFFYKFQAKTYLLPFRWLVVTGIWARFVFTLPLVWFRK